MASRKTRIVFVTGTDTGVGKTVFTVCLLHHLRRSGVAALGIKPFSTGERTDARLLQAVQADTRVPLDEVNPFHFRLPAAPLVAARQARQPVPLPTVVAHIKKMTQRCSVLLVEGVGGVMVPLGDDYTVLDLVAALPCEVILVSRNRLGTINHTLLSAEALRARRRPAARVVVMDEPAMDKSQATNVAVLQEWLSPIPVLTLPFLGPRASSLVTVRASAKKMDKILASVLS